MDKDAISVKAPAKLDESAHRFGTAAISGVPNVGKSTLLNALIGEKIAIVSRKPQTTRHRILGILTTPEMQVAFVDAPGLHRQQKRRLNRVINKTALSSLTDVDVILYMIDTEGWVADREAFLNPALRSGAPIILLINKIDRITDKRALLPLIEYSATICDFAAIIPLSARRLDNRQALLQAVRDHIPCAPRAFPEAQITDKSEKFLATELVREQLILHLGQELPYAVAVQCTRYDDTPRQHSGKSHPADIVAIDMTIWVEKPGQKSIVIGKDGAMLKKTGSSARRQLEQLLGKKVFLNLWVKVQKGWADREQQLQLLGYGEP